MEGKKETVVAKILTRDEILKAGDIKTETVKVPEWGGSVIVKSLTGKERDEYEKIFLDSTGVYSPETENIRANLCALSIVDENGKLIFTKDDVIALGEKSTSALRRVFIVAQRLSGMEETETENLKKNSEKTGGNGLSSG